MKKTEKGKKSPYRVQEERLFSPDIYACSVCGYKSKRAFNTCPQCGTRLKVRKKSGYSLDEMIISDMIFDD